MRVHVPPEPRASSGVHEIRLQGQSTQPEYFRYRSNYLTEIDIEHYSLVSADSLRRPPGGSLCTVMGNIQADSTEGLNLAYINHTNERQRNTRTWQLRIRERDK